MHTVRHAYEKGSLPEYFLRPTSGQATCCTHYSRFSSRASMPGRTHRQVKVGILQEWTLQAKIM